MFANGIIYSSEHGNTTDAEVNIIRKSRNYGCLTAEGFRDKPAELQFYTDSNVAQPLTVWTPTIAPSGIDYYSGDMFPQWKRALLMASLKDQRLYVLSLNAGKDSIVSKSTVSEVAFGRLWDVCIAPSGRVSVSTPIRLPQAQARRWIRLWKFMILPLCLQVSLALMPAYCH